MVWEKLKNKTKKSRMLLHSGEKLSNGRKDWSSQVCKVCFWKKGSLWVRKELARRIKSTTTTATVE